MLTLRAYVKGSLALFDSKHKNEALRLLSENLDLDDKVAELSYEKLIYPELGFSPDATLDPRAVEEVIALRWEILGIERERPTPAKFCEQTVRGWPIH